MINTLSFSKEKLSELLQLMRDYNEFPTYLSRYVNSQPEHEIGKVAQILIDEIVQSLRVHSDKVLVTLKEQTENYTAIDISVDLLKQKEATTLERLALTVLVRITYDNFFNPEPYLANDYLDNSRLFKVYPELRDFHTDENLLKLDAPGIKPHRGGIFYREHCLQYHQFLRRGFTSQPNFDFLGTLIRFAKQHPSMLISVAIDHTRLMPKKAYREIKELDIWFGRPFKWDWIDDPYKIGLTVHWRKPDSLNNLIEKMDSTEFFWSYKNFLKSLQIEEIHPLPTDPEKQKLILNRYVHSQRDIDKHTFVHLDGAVKVYNYSEYKSRNSTQMPNTNKSSHKIKVFRIDGNIPDEDWSSLICYFFRQNEMVLEYFDSDGASLRGDLTV